MMRKFQFLFLTFGFLWLLFSCTGPKTNPPNIIFIIADDMYPEMFNCLPEGKGKNLTPNLDRLADEGVVMLNQYVASPVCTPSRFNCLTGKYASRAVNKEFLNFTEKQGGQTVIQWNTFITEKDKILPHYLKERGYVTGMVGKNHVIEVDSLYFFPDFQADPKDPEIDKQVKANYNKVVSAILRNGFDYAEGIYHNNPNFIGLQELAVQNMEWITAAGLDFIEQNKDNPFFLYFATTIPHQPSSPERSWKANPLVTANGYLDEAPDVMPDRSTLPDRIREARLEGNNKELILWLDDALGALIQKLETLEILDNTFIFFFNDHGQKAKGTLYQHGVKSPAIVWKSGGFPVGNTSGASVQNIDFAPTILDFAGIDNTDTSFDGQSFKPVLEGQGPDKNRPLFFELGFARAIIKGDYKYYAVRYPEYAVNMTRKERIEKLDAYNETRRFRNMKIVNYDPMAPFSHFSVIPGGQQAENESYGTRPAYYEADQLYNIKDDPGEVNNLASDPKFREILEDLKSDLRDYTRDLPGKFNID
jgi:arylsulfatase A-like enzyme